MALQLIQRPSNSFISETWQAVIFGINLSASKTQRYDWVSFEDRPPPNWTAHRKSFCAALFVVRIFVIPMILS